MISNFHLWVVANELQASEITPFGAGPGNLFSRRKTWVHQTPVLASLWRYSCTPRSQPINLFSTTDRKLLCEHYATKPVLRFSQMIF